MALVMFIRQFRPCRREVGC